MKKDTDLKVSFYNVISTLSDSIDMVSKDVAGHHKLVSYIALKIGLELNLEKKDLRKLTFTALIHDLGIFYFDKVIDEIIYDRKDKKHAFVGYCLLNDFFPYPGYDEVLKNHHEDWDMIDDNRNNYLSNIVNLADIVSYFVEKNKHNLIKDNDIVIENIKNNYENKISPDIFSAFLNISSEEYFWLDTLNIEIREKLLENNIRKDLDININLEQLKNLSELVSHIIDFRNSFTATHSKVVSAISEKLASDLRFSKENVKIMAISGYFHDIGKLVLPHNILNKEGRLTKSEWRFMKSHTYYSYYVLDNITELPNLKEWAAFHHETIDGNGYPFKINHEKLSLGSKIMSVADIFTALTEDRPYRESFSENKVKTILREEVKSSKIDGMIVELLTDNYSEYNNLRLEKLNKAKKDYEKFKKRTSKELEILYN